LTPASFAVNLRIPAWSKDAAIKVNGAPVEAAAQPGQWASIKRQWQEGDRLELAIPLRFRRAPIDRWHPNRVAVMRGPVLYAQQIVHKHLIDLPQDDDALNEWLTPLDGPAVFGYRDQEQSSQRDDFMPFYQFAEMQSYRMYFDPELRKVLW
jgi:DUF1680 family protein